MRGTCFYVLGLISRTEAGRADLNRLGWDCPAGMFLKCLGLCSSEKICMLLLHCLVIQLHSLPYVTTARFYLTTERSHHISMRVHGRRLALLFLCYLMMHLIAKRALRLKRSRIQCTQTYADYGCIKRSIQSNCC